jgi:hypothetical protein
MKKILLKLRNIAIIVSVTLIIAFIISRFTNYSFAHITRLVGVVFLVLGLGSVTGGYFVRGDYAYQSGCSAGTRGGYDRTRDDFDSMDKSVLFFIHLVGSGFILWLIGSSF